MNKIFEQTFDEERSLYGISNAKILNCKFYGQHDGESPLKETANIDIDNCEFSLRYPFWHMKHSKISNTILNEASRAGLWYSSYVEVYESTIKSVKFLRECNNIIISDSKIFSEEFSWKSNELCLKNVYLESQYPFFDCNGLNIDNLELNGKYSFQYSKDIKINNSKLNTKDAFWHAENLIISDSLIVGEYLGWYSKNLTFINCKIIGTQPFCYSQNITLKNCTMEKCDLSFENSTVNVSVSSSIQSIKNPISGIIEADVIDEIILDKYRKNGSISITQKSKNITNIY